MKKIIKLTSLIVVIISLLCVFSYGVFLASTGDKSLGSLAKPLKKFATFPEVVSTVLNSNEIKNIPPSYVAKRQNHKKQYNKLDYDLWGINTNFLTEKDAWIIKLFNFRNDEVVHEWVLKRQDFDSKKRKFQNSELRSPILLQDKSILIFSELSNNFYRLDSSSNIIWHNTKRTFHHTMNLDADSMLWACTRTMRGLKYGVIKRASYFDNSIVKMDLCNGEILYEKSIMDILSENGYEKIVLNYTVNPDNHLADPIHLNDIQPAFSDSKYWKTGDLFLSFRHLSLIIVYRPETNELVHFLSGPFLSQHDVDIISDHEIAIFNNNLPGLREKLNKNKTNPNFKLGTDSLGMAEILIYNFETQEYTTHLKSQFDKEKIFTASQGGYEFISNGDVYVENQNIGVVYIMNEDEILLRKVFETPLDGYIEQPHWIRIYESLNFIK